MTRYDLDKPLGRINEPRRDPRVRWPVSIDDVAARNRTLRQELIRRVVRLDLQITAHEIATEVVRRHGGRR